MSPKYFVSNTRHQYLKLVTNARHYYLKLVTNINLQIDDNIQNLKWDSDDCVRFNIDESEIGNLVFDDSNRPWRLWDTAHENKNLPKKIHEASKLLLSQVSHKNVYSYSRALVKKAGCNGNIRGIGNSNRLALTIFVQMTVLAFRNMDESKQSKRPLDWIQRVDAMLLHFRGDHSSCDCLDRYLLIYRGPKIRVKIFA